MNNERKSTRKNSLFYTEVFNEDNQKLAGRLVNLGPEGMMLLSEKPIEPDSIFKLKMVLPISNEDKDAIRFYAESRWCKRDINPEYYDTGFKLMNVSRENRLKLKKYIDEYSFPNSKVSEDFERTD
ncbi:MAG: hypothetical protein GY855_00530 [candidate division Zixibacteria bacterium]|nr:hypothetical protein [candidate division Zixibacteria bacterium]